MKKNISIWLVLLIVVPLMAIGAVAIVSQAAGFYHDIERVSAAEDHNISLGIQIANEKEINLPKEIEAVRKRSGL